MKNLSLVILVAALSFAATFLLKLRAAETTSFQLAEFATVRWAGRENTHVIRPSGKVEKIQALLERFPRPEGIDERVYYLTIAMNAMAKEGYEFAGMTEDAIVMKRTITR